MILLHTRTHKNIIIIIYNKLSVHYTTMKAITKREGICAAIGAGVAITTMPYFGVFGLILACAVMICAYHMTNK